MNIKNQLILFKVLLSVQILCALIGLSIEYASRDANDFSGLAAVLPYGIFSALYVVNFILFLQLRSKLKAMKLSFDVYTKVLIGLVVFLFLGGNLIHGAIQGLGFPLVYTPFIPF